MSAAAAAATRERLPDRRQSETVALRWQGRKVHLCIGFYDDGRPGDCFADLAKAGTDLQHLVSDACVIISLALQHGATPEELSKSLGVVPDLDRGKGATKPASLLGLIVATLIDARHPWPEAVRRAQEEAGHE